MANRKVSQEQKVLNFLNQGKALSNAVATHKLKVNRLPAKINAVSYTHLTLQTNREV